MRYLNKCGNEKKNSHKKRFIINTIILLLASLVAYFSYYLVREHHVQQSYENIRNKVSEFEDESNITEDFLPEEITTMDFEDQKHISQKINPENNILIEEEKVTVSMEILEKYSELIDMNEDTVGWIEIEGTEINYPVLQTENNTYYLNHSFEHLESISGSIFMDYRNSVSEEENLKGHYILYGHNMKNGSMFQNLNMYKNEDFFNEFAVIEMDTIYEELEWDIFSVYITDISNYYIRTQFDDKDDYLMFLEKLQSSSMYKTDTKLYDTDVILTLSTCTYEIKDGRLVIHARLRKR